MLWNSWVYFCVHAGGVFGARPPFLQKPLPSLRYSSNCSFASINVSRHDGEHPFSSLQIIPFFSPSFFVRHHQSYFPLSPSEKAAFHILFFTHSVCLRALIGLSIMHNLTASFLSLQSPPPQAQWWWAQSPDEHLIWILTCFLIENKSAVKFKRLKIHDLFLGSLLFWQRDAVISFFPQNILRHLVFITMAPLHRLLSNYVHARLSICLWTSGYKKTQAETVSVFLSVKADAGLG